MKIEQLIFLFMLSNLILAQDWPQLSYYKEANKALKTSRNTVEAVFFGDSITEGWQQFNPTFFDSNNFVGRGIGGQTTPQLLLRFRQDVLSLRPKKVILLAGINDIAENTGPISLETIMENIKGMTEMAKANDVKMVLCALLPANSFPWRPSIIPTNKVVALNQLIKTYAQEHNLIYVDYYTPMVDDKLGLKSTLGYDTVHPNKAGYALMEEVLLKSLQINE
ncbi:MAG: GDSL-type esterase/lipase family protein [Flavobacteriaceae bacterium]